MTDPEKEAAADALALLKISNAIARVLVHDPTSQVLRSLERRIGGMHDQAGLEAIWLIIHQTDMLAARASNWSQRLRRALARPWGRGQP